MWYTKFNTLKIVFVLFLSCFLCGCMEEEESKIHLFYGNWEVDEIRVTRVNGISGPRFKLNYQLELNSENCGTKYNINGEKTDRIKWVYQENGLSRHFLLSTQGSVTEGAFNLAKDEFYYVLKLNEGDILLTRSIETMQNDTSFQTVWNLILKRE